MVDVRRHPKLRKTNERVSARRMFFVSGNNRDCNLEWGWERHGKFDKEGDLI